MRWHPFYDYSLNCPLFWADGSRGIAEIAMLSAAELGVGCTPAYIDDLNGYFSFLQSLGYIEFARKGRGDAP
jgi:hypothetical protein